MSTRSRIGIINKDGSIDSIYCHFDGYPEGVGETLYNYYQNKKKVKKLIKLGDISSLREKIKPNPLYEHNFDGVTQDDVTVAYHRDRGEKRKDTKHIHHNSLDDFKSDFIGSMIEFTYLYDAKSNNWIYAYIPFSKDGTIEFEDLNKEFNKSISI